jgi:protein SCO1/2
VKKPEQVAGQFARYITVIIIALAGSLAGQRCVCAQGLQSNEGVVRNDGVPRHLKNVTVEQKLGDKVPLGLPLTDSTGKRVKTGYFIDGTKPTIITLNYSSCPMLCSVQLNQLTQSLGELEMQVGKDFNILTVSIDPKETTATAADTKQKYLEQLLRKQPAAEQGWTFCTASQPIITKLADVLGFRYTYDRASGEYFHPAMVAYVSPEGVITRYSLDVGFEPLDMKLALVEAGNGTVGTVVDQFILWCSNYDPDENSFVPQAYRIMRFAGACTIGIVLVCLVPYWISRKGAPALVSNDTPNSEPNSG